MGALSRLTSSDRRVMTALVVATILVRLLFVWGVAPLLAQRGVAADEWPDSYDLYAENILNGYGFAVTPGKASVMRGPVQPLVGALIFLIFGVRNLVAVQVLHALLDGVTALLVFVIGRRAFGRTVGLAAAGVFACYPLSIWYSGKMSMVPLLTMLYCLLCWVVLNSTRGLTVARSLIVGVVLGITTLTLPITLLFPPFLLGLWLLMRLGFARAVVHWIVVCAVAAAVVAPWTIRNYRVSGRFIPVSAGGGYAVLFGDILAERFDGFSPYSDEYPDENALLHVANDRVKALLPPDAAARFSHLDIEPEATVALNRYAVRSLLSRPLWLARKVATQAVTFWYMGNNRVKTIAILLIQLLWVVPWFIAGLCFAWRRRIPAALPLLTLILYLDLAYAASHSNARHGMPAMPIALVFGAFTLCELVRRRRERVGATRPAAATSAA